MIIYSFTAVFFTLTTKVWNYTSPSKSNICIFSLFIARSFWEHFCFSEDNSTSLRKQKLYLFEPSLLFTHLLLLSAWSTFSLWRCALLTLLFSVGQFKGIPVTVTAWKEALWLSHSILFSGASRTVQFYS